MERPFPAYQGDGPYIFVSYSHKDREVVFAGLQWLRDQGFNIWYDEGISPGASWREELAHSILGCDLFIILVSPQSAGSENCLKELNFALEHGRAVLAVHLEPTTLTPGLELALNDRQAILQHDLSEEQYREKILSGVKNHIQQGQVSVSTPPVVKEKSWSVWIPVLVILIAIIGATLFYFGTREEIVAVADDQKQPRSSSLTETETPAPVSTKIRSNWIAVLPFTVLSETEDANMLAKGIPIQMIDSLALISGFSVLPYRSVESLKDSQMEPEEIAKQLNVRYLLDGRVQHSGDKVRISVSLLDGVAGQALWQSNETYDSADLLALQDEVTLLTTRVLSARMASFEQKRLGEMSKVEMEATELFTLSGNYWFDPNQKNLDIAIEDMERAFSLAPTHAGTLASLVHFYSQRLLVGNSQNREQRRAETCDLVSRAILLAREDLQNITNLIYPLLDLCADKGQALQLSERTIEENPQNANSWVIHGYVLLANGDYDAAYSALDKGQELDPNAIWVRYLVDAFRALGFFYQDDWERGMQFARRAVNADPSLYWLQLSMANGLGLIGDDEGAREQWQLVKTRFPELTLDQYTWYQQQRLSESQANRFVEGLRRSKVEQ